MTWKLVAIDNFARENVSDHLVQENIETKEEAEKLCSQWNRLNSGHEAPRFCKVYPQDQALYVFEP